MPDSNTEASTSSQRPVPQSVSTATAEGSITPQYTAVTHDMLDNDPDKYAKVKVAGAALFMVGVVATIVFLGAWHNNGNSTGGTQQP